MGALPLLVLGADGGGTKTLGVVADGDGHELARFQVGPGNPNVVGVEGAATNLLDVVTGCCERAQVMPRDLGTVVFGLAGVGSTGVRDRLAEALRARATARGWEYLAFTIETDARIALEGAFGGDPGVVIIAGTGSILIGKLPDGSVTSVGGWGRVLGDEGSGYAIGSEAVRAVTRDIDRRADAAILRSILASRFGWHTRDAIIAAVYQEKFDLASLAPVVFDAAEKGDQRSLEILHGAATQLADQLAALSSRMEPSKSTGVVFVGGLIDHDTIYSQIVSKEIRKRLPLADIRPALYPPVQGAVIMALNQVKRT
jgi:N-acetylglucosamine kinase-like BadF-type ATPase